MGFNVCQYAPLKTLLLILLFASGNVDAHESHARRIENLDYRLDHLVSSETDQSVELILQRADLNRRQKAWDAAVRDYQRVAEQEPGNVVMLLGRAQLCLDKNDYVKAIFWATRVLRSDPSHIQAGLYYARALAGIGAVDAASLVFDRSINQLEKPLPEHFIEQAKSLLSFKTDPNAMSRAISVLDEGAHMLGNLISLHSLALELEINAEQFEAALHRVDGVLAQSASLLNWRLQRGELLSLMGRQSEARDEVHCLMHRIELLPQQRRSSRAIQTMMDRSRTLADSMSTFKVRNVNVTQACD